MPASPHPIEQKTRMSIGGQIHLDFRGYRWSGIRVSRKQRAEKDCDGAKNLHGPNIEELRHEIKQKPSPTDIGEARQKPKEKPPQQR